MLDTINIIPPHKIGIIGGGQLGKMMSVAAKQMGFHVTILDPIEDCPAAQVADNQIIANYDDVSGISKLVKESHVTTYEFEHISSEILIQLASDGFKISPDPQTLKVIQNKLIQKEYLKEKSIPVPRFLPVSKKEDVERAIELFGFPVLLKACTGGYDGKGNYLIKEQSDIDKGLQFLQNCPLMVEAFIDFSHEVSVMVARSQWGEIVTYPLSENEHRDNILIKNIVPARIAEGISKKSRDIASKVMEVFEGVGIFCVEMFVTKNGDVLVNEIAPRPHNSGHYTIEASITSQFEQHIRAITGLPLGRTDLLTPVVMTNLLGDENYSGPAAIIGCSKALRIPGLRLHFYGKKETKPKRKMGHITVIAPTIEEALIRSEEGANSLKVISI